jgi:hypothetical protein
MLNVTESLRRRKCELWLIALATAASVAWQSASHAYPTAVIFAPTGETLEFAAGEANAYIPVQVRPSVVPAAAWIGLDYGIVPSFTYGSGLGFGGLEVGIDLIDGATHRDETAYVKPIFNAKANVLAQTRSVPALGTGIMSFAPFQRKESVNLTYFAATKELNLRGSSWGTLTLGMGCAAGTNDFAFQGSSPLKHSHLALIAGYVTPEWNRLSLAIDHLGGVSETSATSVALNIAPNKTSSLTVGAYVSNGRAFTGGGLPEGVFVAVGVDIPSLVSEPEGVATK